MRKESELLKRFGNKVRTLRIRRGITSQMELALKAGLDRTYIGGVERGERNIGLKNVEKIARALGVRIQDLMEAL